MGEVTKEALRYDEGKPDVSMLPTLALEEIAKVFMFGAEKYERDNWRKGMKWSKMTASLLRHMFKFMRGEDKDEESGLSHMAHVAWNALCLLEYVLRNKGKDDRHKEPEETKVGYGGICPPSTHYFS